MISYLVSSYDSGQYLDGHLRNLLEEQSNTDLEVVVVVPNSPGIDAIVADKWAKKDNRVNFLELSYREPYGASWLRAWMEAKGEFVCNSNADDFHHPKFNEIFAKVTNTFKGTRYCFSQEPAFWYAGIVVIDEETKQVKGAGQRQPFNKERFSYECDGGPQVCWRNDLLFTQKLNWDLMWERSRQHTSAFDYWLWLYFMSLGYRGESIAECLTYYTQRKFSIENRNKGQNTYEALASIAEFFPHNFNPGGPRYKEHPEFGDFKNLPPKEDWVQARNEGRQWKP
jgi:glycosyltransferase involved in cell wall biosynthesis